MGIKETAVNKVNKLPRLIIFWRWCVTCIWFAFLWVLLNQNDSASWIMGAFFVPVASGLSIALSDLNSSKHSVSFRFVGCITFIPYFLWQSLRGGWDVAKYALHPGMQVNGGFYRYHTTLPEGASRLVLMQVFSLLPGTLCASINKDEILIHVLDIETLVDGDLIKCEQRVRFLFYFQVPVKKEASI
jgi:multicomponent Na+:H+ antiporter subunit E